MRNALLPILALAMGLTLAGCGRTAPNQPELIRTRSATQPPHLLPTIAAATGPLVAGPRGGTALPPVTPGEDASASPTPPTTPGPPPAELTAEVQATLTAGPSEAATPEPEAGEPEESTPTPDAPQPEEVTAEPEEATPAPPDGTPTPTEALAPDERLFLLNCARCHLPHGRGVEGLYPALDGNPFVTGDPQPLTETVLHGRGAMPPFADRLSDEEIAAVLTYIRGAWSNEAGPISPEAVAEAR